MRANRRALHATASDDDPKVTAGDRGGTTYAAFLTRYPAGAFLLRMFVGLTATVLGALPLALRLPDADFDNVLFLSPPVVFGVGFLCVLVLTLVRLAFTKEASVECLIARATLAPGGINVLIFTVERLAQQGG